MIVFIKTANKGKFKGRKLKKLYRS